MTTLAELQQRLEDDFLEPVTDRTPSAPLTATMSDSTDSFTFDASVLSPDEESLIGPGQLLELDAELVEVTEYAQSTSTITCERQKRGTQQVAHAEGTDVRIPTRFLRKSQYEELEAAIEGLWQPLFVEQETLATVGASPWLALPLNTVRIIEVKYQDSDGRWDTATAELFKTHPLDSAQAAIQIQPGIATGALCRIRYGIAVEIPDTWTDTIENLPTRWERIVLLDAAANLLSGVDIDAITQEILTERLRLENFPVRAGQTITQALIGVREYLVNRAAQSLTASAPTTVRMKPVNYVS